MTGISDNSDNAKLVQMIYRYLSFIRLKDGEGVPISFQDRSSFPGREEGYKARTFVKAQEALQIEKWTEDWISNGKILACVRKAMDCDVNLVNHYQKTRFRNIINPEHEDYNPDAARVFYDIYKSKGEKEEATAFTEAMKVFGGNYDTLAYLFFIKDQSRFLPVSPGHFDRSLDSVGFKHELSYHCSWKNYTEFIDIVKDVKDVLQDILPDVEIRLIDAHSFLWGIQEKSDPDKDKYGKDGKPIWFLDWDPDAEAMAQIEEGIEGYLQQKATGATGAAGSGGSPVRRSILTNGFVRSSEVVRITKARAKGFCELCGQPAPFEDRKGEPYLEAHHITWLSRDGADDTDNTAALCPNCHTKMHVVDDEADVEKLMRLRSR